MQATVAYPAEVLRQNNSQFILARDRSTLSPICQIKLPILVPNGSAIVRTMLNRCLSMAISKLPELKGATGHVVVNVKNISTV